MSAGRSIEKLYPYFKMMYLGELVTKFIMEILPSSHRNDVEEEVDENIDDLDFESESDSKVEADEEHYRYFLGDEKYDDGHLGFGDEPYPIERDAILERIASRLEISYALAYKFAERVRNGANEDFVTAEMEVARQLSKCRPK